MPLIVFTEQGDAYEITPSVYSTWIECIAYQCQYFRSIGAVDLSENMLESARALLGVLYKTVLSRKIRSLNKDTRSITKSLECRVQGIHAKYNNERSKTYNEMKNSSFEETANGLIETIRSHSAVLGKLIKETFTSSNLKITTLLLRQLQEIALNKVPETEMVPVAVVSAADPLATELVRKHDSRGSVSVNVPTIAKTGLEKPLANIDASMSIIDTGGTGYYLSDADEKKEKSDLINLVNTANTAVATSVEQLYTLQNLAPIDKLDVNRITDGIITSKKIVEKTRDERIKFIPPDYVRITDIGNIVRSVGGYKIYSNDLTKFLQKCVVQARLTQIQCDTLVKRGLKKIKEMNTSEALDILGLQRHTQHVRGEMMIEIENFVSNLSKYLYGDESCENFDETALATNPPEDLF